MADYGLLGGIGQALQSGVSSYRQAREASRRESEQEALRKRQEKMDRLAMMRGGIQETNQGGFAFTPEEEKRRELQDASTEAEIAYKYGKAYEETPEGLVGKKIPGWKSPEERKAEIYMQKQAAQSAREAAKEERELERKGTIGQQAADRSYAKKYTEFRATGGEASLDESVGTLEKQLEEFKKLKDEEIIPSTGPLTGLLQGPIFTPKAEEIKKNVENVVQGQLRKTLGAQFTEKEGQRILSQMFNPYLSPEANIRNFERELGKIKALAESQKRSAQYFEKYGTLRGYQGPMPVNVAEKTGIDKDQDESQIVTTPDGKKWRRLSDGSMENIGSNKAGGGF